MTVVWAHVTNSLQQQAERLSGISTTISGRHATFTSAHVRIQAGLLLRSHIWKPPLSVYSAQLSSTVNFMANHTPCRYRREYSDVDKLLLAVRKSALDLD